MTTKPVQTSPDAEAPWRRNVTVVQLVLAMAPLIISMFAATMSYAAFRTSVEMRIASIEEKNKNYDKLPDRISELVTGQRVLEERSREHSDAFQQVNSRLDHITQLLEQRK